MTKRKKHVFHTGEIPHLWAHRTQDEARNRQGNLYFTGDTIYSYGSHFPIARHVSSETGERAILFTTGTHSVTTTAANPTVDISGWNTAKLSITPPATLNPAICNSAICLPPR